MVVVEQVQGADDGRVVVASWEEPGGKAGASLTFSGGGKICWGVDWRCWWRGVRETEGEDKEARAQRSVWIESRGLVSSPVWEGILLYTPESL